VGQVCGLRDARAPLRARGVRSAGGDLSQPEPARNRPLVRCTTLSER
jgi:hypothetical protein